MIRTILLVVAVLIFVLLGLDVFNAADAFKWEMAGLAFGFAALIAWPV